MFSKLPNQKEIGKIKFGKLINFSHEDAIYKLNFGQLKFAGRLAKFAKLSCYTV